MSDSKMLNSPAKKLGSSQQVDKGPLSRVFHAQNKTFLNSLAVLSSAVFCIISTPASTSSFLTSSGSCSLYLTHQ